MEQRRNAMENPNDAEELAASVLRELSVRLDVFKKSADRETYFNAHIAPRVQRLLDLPRANRWKAQNQLLAIIEEKKGRMDEDAFDELIACFANGELPPNALVPEHAQKILSEHDWHRSLGEKSSPTASPDGRDENVVDGSVATKERPVEGQPRRTETTKPPYGKDHGRQPHDKGVERVKWKQAPRPNKRASKSP